MLLAFSDWNQLQTIHCTKLFFLVATRLSLLPVFLIFICKYLLSISPMVVKLGKMWSKPEMEEVHLQNKSQTFLESAGCSAEAQLLLWMWTFLISCLCCTFPSFTATQKVAGEPLETSPSPVFRLGLQRYLSHQSNYKEIFASRSENTDFSGGFSDFPVVDKRSWISLLVCMTGALFIWSYVVTMSVIHGNQLDVT